MPAAAQKPPEPTPGPTAEQVAKVVAECRKKLIFLRPAINPFTGQLEYSFSVREPIDSLPEIPFPHILLADRGGLQYFDPSRPGISLQFAFDTKLTDLNPKRARAAKSLAFNSPTTYSARDLDLLESAETLTGPFGDADLEVLKTLKNLKNLSTSGTVGPAGMKALADFPALERLHLVGRKFDRKSAAEGLEQLKSMKRLTQLGIYNHPGLPEGTLETIGALPALTHLELVNVKVARGRGNFAEALERAKSLTSLRLVELELEMSGDRFCFKEFPVLAELSLEGSWTTDDWLKPVEQLKNLHSVTLNKTAVSDTGLRALSRLPLHSLVIVTTSRPATTRDNVAPISGPGVVAVVKDLKSISVLGLDGVRLFPPVLVNKGPGEPFGAEKPEAPPIDAAATKARKAETVAALKSLTGLRCLNLVRTGVTDEDVEWIVDLKSLEYLYVDAKVTPACIAKIKAGLPKCTVERSPEFPALFGKEPPK